MTESTETTAPEKIKRTRGPNKPKTLGTERNAAGLSIDQSSRAGLTMSEDAGRDPNTAVKNERVRIPMGVGQDTWLRGYVLDHSKFHYHLFHESQTRSGRVMEADAAFYEHCQINGENIKRPSGSGFDYLMRLPLKYYNEDVERDRQKRDLLEKNHSKLSSNDKLQEYGTDKHGRPVFDEARPTSQSTSTQRNPYAD